MKLYPMYCVPCFMKHSSIVYPNVKTDTFGYSVICPECNALVITRLTKRCAIRKWNKAQIKNIKNMKEISNG